MTKVEDCDHKEELSLLFSVIERRINRSLTYREKFFIYCDILLGCVYFIEDTLYSLGGGAANKEYVINKFMEEKRTKPLLYLKHLIECAK